MNRDLRDTATFREAAALLAAACGKLGRIASAHSLCVEPKTDTAYLIGELVEEECGEVQAAIFSADLRTGDVRIVQTGAGAYGTLAVDPQGDRLAFSRSRRDGAGSELCLLDRANGRLSASIVLPGRAEFICWSPSGTSLLVAVAAAGTDVAGVEGAAPENHDDGPAWLPEIRSTGEVRGGRSLWRLDPIDWTLSAIELRGLTPWEAVWTDEDQLVLVASELPGEDGWYRAAVSQVDLGNGAISTLYQPQHQIGCLATSPAGTIAFVHGLCSDRGIVAGDVRIFDPATGTLIAIDHLGFDVTFCDWQDDGTLLLAGHGMFETSVGLLDSHSREFSPIWVSTELSVGDRYVTVAKLAERDSFAILAEGFRTSPEIGVVRAGNYQTAVPLDSWGLDTSAGLIGSVRERRWQASDGQSISGWLLCPPGQGPFPVVMNLHGGPVWMWHPMWLGRERTLPLLLLLKRGYAIFLPNPRGSTGRGLDFSAQVVGDMGGADAEDCRTGITDLIASGLADPNRLGVMGISYGGFLTSCLVALDPRLAAGVAVSPVTNFVTQHLISNIPAFDALFLDDALERPSGEYVSRSPVMRAAHVAAPMLIVCGQRDRCTPPSEAAQLYSALRLQGTNAALVTYPEEGHGVGSFPAALDYAARVVSWFEAHFSAGESRERASA